MTAAELTAVVNALETVGAGIAELLMTAQRLLGDAQTLIDRLRDAERQLEQAERRGER